MEGLIALAIFLLTLLILLAVYILIAVVRLIKSSRDQNFAMRVIVDNLIEIVSIKYYEQEEKEDKID